MATNCSRMKEQPLLPSTQLRHLKPKLRNKLIQILNVGNGWQELAMVIPKPNGDGSYLFSANDICVLEQQWKYGTSPAQALLEHWSTMGEKQPTLQDLLDLLVEAKLLRAANYVSSDLLKEPIVPPEDSNISSEEFEALLKHATGDSISELSTNGTLIPNLEIPVDDTAVAQFYMNCENQEREGLTVYQYRILEIITRQFSNVPVCHGGSKLGEGAFGTVYRGCIKDQWLAIKKLKDSVDSQFETELRVLTRYRHENLLSLLGYSNDGPSWCLVYAYMANGSLQERLACVESTAPIHWLSRIRIACGTAQGINYLHTFGDEPLVHRDIKSANVLLDEKLIPKVGDFGLARIGNSNATSTVLVTKNIYGTSVYMAREAFRGDVSVKLDTFSFGVVLMELLTGLPPYDDFREEKDLVSYMEEKCNNILPMLDSEAGIWDKNIAVALYEIAKLCIEERKRNRPTIAQVLPKLEALLQQCEHNASG